MNVVSMENQKNVPLTWKTIGVGKMEKGAELGRKEQNGQDRSRIGKIGAGWVGEMPRF